MNGARNWRHLSHVYHWAPDDAQFEMKLWNSVSLNWIRIIDAWHGGGALLKHLEPKCQHSLHENLILYFEPIRIWWDERWDVRCDVIWCMRLGHTFCCSLNCKLTVCVRVFACMCDAHIIIWIFGYIYNEIKTHTLDITRRWICNDMYVYCVYKILCLLSFLSPSIQI